MLKDNPLLAQLKQQIRETIPTIEGTVRATDKNYGFLVTDNKKSYFISPPNMKNLIHGDRISAALREDGDKQSAEPEALLEQGLERFIGQVQFKDGKTRLRVDHNLINRPLAARSKKNAEFKLQEGDWVVAELKQHGLKDQRFLSEIQSVIANKGDKFARWKATTAKHQLAWEEPANQYQFELAAEARLDETEVLYFTIDGEHTKDMDDAISITANDNGWTLKVAIADPSAYISTEHPLDKLAAERAFTLYLPAHTVPMMPSELANQRCSLIEGEQRPALVCEMQIDADGKLDEQCRFYLASICSKARLSYQQVAEFIENQQGDFSQELAEQLKQLDTCTAARYQWREQNTTVFGDQADYHFQLDQNGKVIDIERHPRRASNRMVEEAMVMANVSAGRYLADKLGFGIYSYHLGFKEDKQQQVAQILEARGYEGYSFEKLQELDSFCQLRREIQAKNDKLSDALLKRFYDFSHYGDKPLPHFGLGEQQYATWTSPIRKYSDLLNHRLIKATLLEQDAESPLTQQLAEHLSEARRKHKFAEKDMGGYLYSLYFAEQDHQQNLQGEIISLNSGGLLIKLLESGAVGFLPKSVLAKQAGLEAKQVEINIEGGELKAADAIYQLSQPVNVSIAKVDLESHNITLNLAKDSA